MREWTLEERYRVLESPEDIRELHDRNAASIYRQTYHVQPVTGLSSDPNGFVKHNGLWHLFYQWCPWGAVHGLKYWYHVTSEDLVVWKNAGVGLKPDRDFDNKGTHSGSAISVADKLYFFYTGNHR
ncbi:MAG: sucrose-6-phosphate hydrolase, partial [Oscillospiraceae bacterium]|nr:sucrose-6-phosphate hydrolase [Oscillospiraceae bacterium]